MDDMEAAARSTPAAGIETLKRVGSAEGAKVEALSELMRGGRLSGSDPALRNAAESVRQAGEVKPTVSGRIDLPGGWYLIRDDDPGSAEHRNPHHLCWFLSEPEGIWVAKFWDGPEAGGGDCAAFARSLGVGAPSESTVGTAETDRGPDVSREVLPHDEPEADVSLIPCPIPYICGQEFCDCPAADRDHNGQWAETEESYVR